MQGEIVYKPQVSVLVEYVNISILDSPLTPCVDFISVLEPWDISILSGTFITIFIPTTVDPKDLNQVSFFIQSILQSIEMTKLARAIASRRVSKVPSGHEFWTDRRKLIARHDRIVQIRGGVYI